LENLAIFQVPGKLGGPMIIETDPFDPEHMQITFRIYAILDDKQFIKLVLRYKPRDFQQSNYTLRIKSKVDLNEPINRI
jgi:hypothetical protein